MSRVGNKPVAIADGVKIAVNGRTVSVEGPKGKLSWEHRPEVSVTVDAGAKQVVVKRENDERQARAHRQAEDLSAGQESGQDPPRPQGKARPLPRHLEGAGARTRQRADAVRAVPVASRDR